MRNCVFPNWTGTLVQEVVHCNLSLLPTMTLNLEDLEVCRPKYLTTLSWIKLWVLLPSIKIVNSLLLILPWILKVSVAALPTKAWRLMWGVSISTESWEQLGRFFIVTPESVSGMFALSSYWISSFEFSWWTMRKNLPLDLWPRINRSSQV